MKRYTLLLALSFVFGVAMAQSGYGTDGDFNPENPAIPGPNGFYPDEGLLVLDGIRNGDVYEAITNLFGYLGAEGAQSNEQLAALVTKVIICGDMTPKGNEYVSSLYVLGYFFPNIAELDLTRTYGWTCIWDIDEIKGLKVLHLPDCLEIIYSLDSCKQLTDVFCYADIPPVVDTNFSYTGQNLFAAEANVTVHVPDASVDMYKVADGWKEATIVALTDGLSKIFVKMPGDIALDSYRGMNLSLTDENSGLSTRYVTSDRTYYMFPGLKKASETTWTVTLSNRFGSTVAQVSGIKTDAATTDVLLTGLKPVMNGTVTVLDDEGKDVTGLTDISWFDKSGLRLNGGNSLAGFIKDDQALVQVKLAASLASKYAQPSQLTVTATDNGADATVRLQQMKKHTVKAVLRDSQTHHTLPGISVTAVQTYAEGCTATYTAETDAKGQFSVDVLEGALLMSFASDEYARMEVEANTLSAVDGTVDLGDVNMRQTGARRITVNMTFKEASVSGDGQTEGFYTGYNNVQYSITNLSTGKEVTDFYVQYPYIIMMDGVGESDRLAVTLTSSDGKFDPFQNTVTLNGGTAELDAALVERGGFRSTFKSTENSSVAAVLYDSNGNLVDRYVHATAKLEVKDLPEGIYTLVTMANDPLLTKLPTLQSFSEMGLTAVIDYIQNTVTVTPGKIALVENNTVPTLDVEKYKVLHSSSTFSFDKTTILEGSYLTLRTRLKLKNDYASSWKYSGFKLVLELPENCKYLENSLIVDGNPMSCKEQNGKIVISGISNTLESGGYADIRLCLVAGKSGKYKVSGKILYDYLGDEYASPAGTATYTAKELEYSISELSYNGNVSATGTAPEGSKITILDGGKVIAQKYVAGERWLFDEAMADTANLSIHPITVMCETQEGNVYTSPATTVLVEKDLNHVAKVTMYYPNGYSHRTEVITFDFIHPSTLDEKYDFYPPSRSFSFVIDFLRNDPTEIDNVVLFVENYDGTIEKCKASYDSYKKAWVANYTLADHFSNAIVNVYVSFDRLNVDIKADRYGMESSVNEINGFIDEINGLMQILSGMNEDNIDEKIKAYENAVGYPVVAGATEEVRLWEDNFNTLTKEQRDAEIDKLLAESQLLLDSLSEQFQNICAGISSDGKMTISLEDGSTLVISDCSGYDESTILDAGFESQSVNDGSTLYILQNKQHSVMVDFKSNRSVEVIFVPEDSRLRLGVLETCEQGISQITSQIDWAKMAFDKILSAAASETDKILLHLSQLQANIAKFEIVLRCTDLSAFQRATLNAKLYITKAAALTTEVTAKIAAKAPTLLKKIVPILSYVEIAKGFIENFHAIASLYMSVPVPCPKDQAAADAVSDFLMTGAQLQIAYSAGKLALQIASDLATATSVVAALPSGGTSLLVAAGSYIAKNVALVAADWAFEKSQKVRTQQARQRIRALKCKKEDDEPDEPEDPEDPDDPDDPDDPGDPVPPEEPKPRRKIPLIDPSGFVCEAVESNRLEGVTATVYYKDVVEDMYGDKTEQTVVWDAENYGQENPLLTDAKGMYSWMVPAGQWQVVYQMEGYETARSPWLPVPPPQLDVNVALTRYAQPSIANARATEYGIDLNFDLFMKTSTVSNMTVTVFQDGNPVSGKLEAANAEDAFEKNGQKYASRYHFAFDRKLAAGSKVLVKVSSLAKSYAGIAVGEDIEKELTVGREIFSIGADTVTSVPYGGSHQLVIKAVPGDAAAMQTVNIRMESEMIAGLETHSVVLDAQGQAYITIFGNIPGTAYMYFSLEGTDYTGVTKVNVIKDNAQIPDAPRASLISGTYVAPGTKVELTAQNGCTIWYTLDGSCPCDEAKRIRYTGPITIEADTHLRALAQAADGTESESVTFTWFVASTDIEEIILVPVDPEAIYDLQGRKLTGAPQGIYIRSGKKILK